MWRRNGIGRMGIRHGKLEHALTRDTGFSHSRSGRHSGCTALFLNFTFMRLYVVGWWYNIFINFVSHRRPQSRRPHGLVCAAGMAGPLCSSGVKAGWLAAGLLRRHETPLCPTRNFGPGRIFVVVGLRVACLLGVRGLFLGEGERIAH